MWETVKRVEGGDQGLDIESHDRLEGEDDPGADSDAEFAAELAQSRTKKADAGIGSKQGRDKKERRVVTAIFAGNSAAVSDQPNSAPKINGEDTRDDSQDEVVRLRSQVDETWTLLQAFKRRLEEVENKIENMEERARLLTQEDESAAQREEDRRENERRMAHERERARVKEAEAAERVRIEDNRSLLALVLQPRTLFSRLLQLISPSAPATSSSTRARDSSKFDRILHPTTISALPPYFLLVSIGVCAVVLRVVIRRMLGRRRAWDF